jgi:hypothetical protein
MQRLELPHFKEKKSKRIQCNLFLTQWRFGQTKSAISGILLHGLAENLNSVYKK